MSKTKITKARQIAEVQINCQTPTLSKEVLSTYATPNRVAIVARILIPQSKILFGIIGLSLSLSSPSALPGRGNYEMLFNKATFLQFVELVRYT